MKNHGKLDAVLFDLDGTLIDTAPDFAIVVNQLCDQHGIDRIGFSDIRRTVSHGARALVTLAFGIDNSDSRFETLRLQLLDLYSQHLAVKTSLFDGMEELLDWIELRSLPWGIVTNKPRLYAEPILTALNLDSRCQVLVCPDDVTHTKPDPEPMLLACRHLACETSNTIYVGDHRRDIEAGQNSEMITIAANYGYIDPLDPSDSWNADYSVSNAKEILPILRNNFS